MYTPAHPRSTAGLVLAGIYLALAVLGLLGTWYFNLVFIGSNSTMSYVEAWFANPASTSAAVDVAVTAIAANIFFVREGIRLGFRKWSWVLIPLTYLLALAFAFPLFLALRELRLSRRGADAPPHRFAEAGRPA